MKIEDYAYAHRIRERMAQLNDMKIRLREAWDKVREKKTSDASVQLAELIHDLIQDYEGELVVDAFYSHFMLKFDDWKKDLEKEFDAL